MASQVPLVFTPAVVREVTPETADTLTFSLDLKDGRGPADFMPGQFNMLYAYGVGEVPISVASSRRDKSLMHTVRSVGMVTSLVAKMGAGDVLGLRGPFGRGWPIEAALGKQLIVVAGGLGLPPLRPVITEALAQPDRFRGTKILYGARTPKDLIFKREHAGWSASKGCEFHLTVDRGDDGWKGNVGVVTTLFRKTDFDPDEAVAFVCGPEIMVKFATLELVKMGVPPEKVFVSLERNMKCGAGTCGHCQLGPLFICRDGPIFSYQRVKRFFAKEGV